MPGTKQNVRFNPSGTTLVYILLFVVYKRKMALSRTTFVNPEMEKLQKELELIKHQKRSIDMKNVENTKNEIVRINGEQYRMNGFKMNKVVKNVKPKSDSVCLQFCKYGVCSNENCPFIHDRNLVRICPSFLKVVTDFVHTVVGLLHQRDLYLKPHHDS